jgi:hypothetical protein
MTPHAQKNILTTSISKNSLQIGFAKKYKKMHAVSLARMQNMKLHEQWIRAALAAFKGNIYQKHICTQIVLL